jgi:hypothetical protein
MTIRADDDIIIPLKKPIAMFIARGHPGNRWYEGADGELVLKDEYAENIPEALIKICEALNWQLIVLFAGRPPKFGPIKLRYSEKYPNVAKEMDFSDFDFQISNRKRELLIENKAHFATFSDTTEFQSLFEYKGVNFSDQIEEKLTKDIPALSANLQTLYELWSNIFSTVRPEMIIGGRLDVMPYLVSAAKAHDVYICNVKLGVGEEMLAPFAIKDKEDHYETLVIPDLTILWGTAQKKLIEDRFPGYPSRLVVSGRTRNDSFASAITKTKLNTVREELGIEENDDVILFGGNNRTFFGLGDGESSGTCCLSPHSLKKTITALATLAKNRGNCKIIVKPHPVDDSDFIKEICDELDNVVFIHPINPYHNSVLLSLSIVFVSSASSMFTEAISADCLPVNLWINDVNYLYEYERKEIWGHLSINTESIEGLEKLIVPYLEDEKLRKTTCNEMKGKLSRYVGHSDGLNSERAIGLSFMNYAKQIKDKKLKKDVNAWLNNLSLKLELN